MSSSHTALIFSLGLHATVATVAYFGLPSLWKEPPTPVPAITIEFVEVDMETRLSAPKDREKEPEAAPKNTSQFAKEEAFVPEASAEAVPTLEAAKIPKPKPRPKPTVTKRQKLVSNAKPRSRPKPPSRFQTKKLAALIDRSIKEDSDVAEKQKEDAKESEAKAERKLFGSFRNKLATASLMEAIRQQLIDCWDVPSGVKGVETMTVTIRIWTKSDGSLQRAPKMLDAGDLNAAGRGAYRTFAESARNAVYTCEPFKGLPEERYEEWKELDILFDPKEMF